MYRIFGPKNLVPVFNTYNNNNDNNNNNDYLSLYNCCLIIKYLPF